MAERASDSKPQQRVFSVPGRDGSDESDNCVELEKRDGRRGIVEIHFPRFDRRGYFGRDRIRVDLEPDLERCGRTDGFLHDFVHSCSVRPELLVAEGVEAKDSLTGRQGLR